MRHALEPDHLTAVSTIVVENRNSRRGVVLGAFWGIGHTASLLTVGVVLAALHARMPERLADGFELFVAVMLVVLASARYGAASAKASAGSFMTTRTPRCRTGTAPRPTTCTSVSGRSPVDLSS